MPDPADLTEDLGFLLSRASGLVVRATNTALGDLGLRVRQYSVLSLACDRAEPMSQRALAELLGLDPSQVVALVDELVDAGLVERRAAPTDRRTRLVVATPEGRRVRAVADVHGGGGRQRALQALSPDEQAVLRTLLARVVDGACSHGG